MKNFDKRILTLLEDMGNTSGAVFGAGQAHAFQIGQSGDFYAPGDARNLFGSKKKNKFTPPVSKFKPPGFKKGKVIRRTPAGM
jgi:hypothetical protein